jgi:hypothetical protein
MYILGFCILLRVLCQGYQKKQSFPTVVQCVYCTHTSTATCLGPHCPSSGGIHNVIYKEVIILTTDPLCVVQIVMYTLFDRCCRRLFKCDCEICTRACNHLAFNIR